MKGPAAEAGSPAASPDGPSPTCQTRHNKDTERTHAVCLSTTAQCFFQLLKTSKPIQLSLRLFSNIFNRVCLFVATLW